MEVEASLAEPGIDTPLRGHWSSGLPDAVRHGWLGYLWPLELVEMGAF